MFSSKFVPPSIEELIGKDIVKYSHKPIEGVSQWADRKPKDYILVEPSSKETLDLNYQVETSFSTTVETATEIATNVVVEVDCNYALAMQYTALRPTEPRIAETPSSDLLSITQILNKMAGTKINEGASRYKLDGNRYDYRDCFDDTKALVMPDPSDFFLIPKKHTLQNRVLYISEADRMNVDTVIDDVNRILSFNQALYIRCGKIEDPNYQMIYHEMDSVGGTIACYRYRSVEAKPEAKDALYITSSSYIRRFEAPLIPVTAINALTLLQQQPWIYGSGLDLSILPLGFFIVPVTIISKDYNGEPDEKNKSLIIKYEAISNKHYVLDWSQSEYDRQKDIYNKNLANLKGSNDLVKALLTIDHLEFVAANSEEEEIANNLKIALNQDLLTTTQEDNRANLFLYYCSLIKKDNENLYISIKQTILRDLPNNTNPSHLISRESLDYLKEFARIALLPNLEVESQDIAFTLDIQLATYKADFIKAAFNSMDKSNFLQTSRALKAFFIKFDEMTNFEDARTKLKFYKLLIERTVNNDRLCLKGIEGCAQIELFRLIKILNKAAAVGSEFLELQLRLLRSKVPNRDVFQDESDISIGPYGDARAHHNVASANDAYYKPNKILTKFGDCGIALTDPLMKLALPDMDLEEEIPLGHHSDEDIEILGWISRKLGSNTKLFGTTNIEHKIAIYNKVKALVLRIEELLTQFISKQLRDSFSDLCKLYIKNSLSIELSAFNEVLIWMEALKQEGNANYIYLQIPRIEKNGNPVIESEKFRGLFYNMYGGYLLNTSPVATNINNLNTDNEFNIITFNIHNDAKLFNKTDSSIAFLTRIVAHRETNCLLVHNKKSVSKPGESTDTDFLRYKKLWNVNEGTGDSILAAKNPKGSTRNLKGFFTSMSVKFLKVVDADNKEVRDAARLILLKELYRQTKEKEIKEKVCKDVALYKDTVIDTRFLSIHALCSNMPNDLTPEKDLENVIDWINQWVDSCDLSLKNSKLKLIDYSVLRDHTMHANNYEELSDSMGRLFPDIKYAKGREFSFDNILKGPNKIQLGKAARFRNFIGFTANDSTAYEPMEFFQRLDQLIKSSDLEDQKNDIFYNAIYKLFEYKIYQTQIAIFKNGSIQNIEFKDPEKLEKYTSLVCESYLKDNKNASNTGVKDLFQEVSGYIEFALPILEDFNGDASILEFYKPFHHIYGKYIGKFFGKIKSYGDILKYDSVEKFPDKERETSSKNFYKILGETINLWKPSSYENAYQYFTEFHKYVDKALDFGVLSQGLNGHNFTATMQTALGLLGNKELGGGLEKFDFDKQNSAAGIFERLTQISIRRADCLVFDYFAYLTKGNETKLFTELARQLQHNSDGVEELIYNLNSKLYGERFKAFALIISEKDNLGNKIALLNRILTNHYGEDKESIITNFHELRELLGKLNDLKEDDIQLLKRYLVPPASDLYGKSQFNDLFKDDRLDTELCKQRLQSLLKAGRYILDEEEITNKFSKIIGLEDLNLLVKSYKEVFSYLIAIQTIDDSKFQEQLADIDKRNPVNNLKLAAYIIDGVYRITGKIMRPIQIAVFLETIKSDDNLFNQIQTGQGKTDIISMVAAFYGMKGFRVDISTDTFELASRDAKNLSPLYTFLGVTSSVNAVTTKGTQIDDYTKALINYGTLGEIKLFKNLTVQSGKLLPNGRTILLSDEFDADRDNKSLYRLSRTPEFTGIKNPSACLRTMQEHMVDFVDNETHEGENKGKNTFNPGKRNQKQQEDDKSNFKELIARKATELSKKAEEAKALKDMNQHFGYSNELAHLEQIHDMIPQIRPKEIALLLNSAHSSKLALENGKKVGITMRFQDLSS